MDKPTKFPRWADQAGGSDVTEPSEPEKDDGWIVGNPVRQFMNWLQLIAYQWLVWLDQVTFRFSDFGPDQALPGSAGDLPSTGAGLGPVAAGDFAASVVADGYRLGPIDSPEHTYSATSDTYWDLGRDGEWTPAVVAATDPAPAVTADSVRVYMVRTDATDRTAVTDFRRTHTLLTSLLDLSGVVRYGEQRRGSQAEFSEARQVTLFDGSNVLGYTLVHAVIDDETPNTRRGMRLYARHRENAGTVTEDLVFVTGCSWDGAQWVADTELPERFTMLTLNAENLRPRQLLTAIVTSPFDDDVWYQDETAANGTQKKLTADGAIHAGNALGNSGYEVARVARYTGVEDVTEGYRTYQADFGHLKIFSLGLSSVGVDAAVGRGGELVSNATYNEDDDEWSRIGAGDSYLIEVASAGVRILRRAAADASPWSDIIDASSGWTLIKTFGAPVVSKLSLTGADFQDDGSAGWAGGAGQDAANTFPALTRTPGGAAGAAAPIHLPQGAIITGARWFGSVNNAAANMRVWLQRSHKITGTSDSLMAGSPDYDTFINLALITASELTIDEIVGVRTIDNDTYHYAACYYYEPNAGGTVTGLEIDYTTLS